MQAVEDSFWHTRICQSRIFEPVSFRDEQKERSVSFLSNLWYSLWLLSLSYSSSNNFTAHINLKNCCCNWDDCFHVPVLATRDDIKVEQKEPYGEILISRGAKMWKEGRLPQCDNLLYLNPVSKVHIFVTLRYSILCYKLTCYRNRIVQGLPEKFIQQ